MRNHIIIPLLAAMLSLAVAVPRVHAAQRPHRTKNLVVVTIDGFRWQEVFHGASQKLINDQKYVHDVKQLKADFWSSEQQVRRHRLMPFLWNVIAKNGQIYGDRDIGNKVNVANPYWFSYPGYNEIFTGFPDKRIDSNNYPDNPNTNVLAYINGQAGFRHRVAAFGSWTAFTRILNQPRSGFPVNDGYENVAANLAGQPLTATQQMLNRLQHHFPHFIGTERYDGLTFALAFQYLKVNHPRVYYIAFGDPDDFGHKGRYDLYLHSAHYIDAMIGRLWSYLQETPQYAGKTTLFITVDHGRGRGHQWTSHGRSAEGSGQIWFAIIGPDTPAAGVVKTHEQLYQKQFAQTMAHFLGLTFTADHPVAKRIRSVEK